MDAALKLAEGTSEEETVLGATLVLRFHSALLADQLRGKETRLRLRAALTKHSKADTLFISRLLQSSPPLQRLALSLLRVLLAGTDDEAEEAAQAVRACAAPLVSACAGESAAAPPKQGERGADEQACWGAEEVTEALEVLKRLLELSPPSETATEAEDDGSSPQQGVGFLEQECCRLVAMLLAGAKLRAMLAEEAVAGRALALAQELLVRSRYWAETGHSSAASSGLEDIALELAEAAALDAGLRGSDAHAMALGLLSEGLTLQDGRMPRVVPESADEILGSAVAGGARIRACLLQLLATLVAGHGLSLGIARARQKFLGRLKPLLVLASGELRLALEGYGTREGLCAACMSLEAIIVAFGKESEELEQSADLEEVAACLSELHRALQDVYDYCCDLPASGVQSPEELALVARVAAAFQLEDPRRFDAEFRRSLPAFCGGLGPAEFQVLLPCLQELQDWHLTPALAKVLEVAHWGLLSARAGQNNDASEVWRQCAMMLAEVALDAAVYLPEASMTEPPTSEEDLASTSQPTTDARRCEIFAVASAAFSAGGGVRLPRPLQAADTDHAGVRRLASWSCSLWSAGAPWLSARGGALMAELSILCGCLLTSVPAETLAACWPKKGPQPDEIWAALVDSLYVGKDCADASTWRLAMRLAGFVLDRHAGLGEALAQAAAQHQWVAPQPPIGAVPDHDDDDEYALADRAARKLVQDFLLSASTAMPVLPTSVASSTRGTDASGGYAEALDGMD